MNKHFPHMSFNIIYITRNRICRYQPDYIQQIFHQTLPLTITHKHH